MLLIKIGGSAIENLEEILSDLPNENLVIVHGGAKKVTQIAKSMGIIQKFVVSPSGYRSRYTDEKTIEIFQMVIAGKINKDIVRILLKFGRKSVGLCGIDNSIVVSEKKKKIIVVEEGKKKLVDGGYTGRIKKIDIEFIQSLLKNSIIPVIGSVAISEEFEPLNINADSLAVKMASELDSDQLVFFTDTDGILDKDGNTIKTIKLSQLGNLNVGYGMKRKLFEIAKSEADRIIIANGLKDNPFSKFRGTVIENDRR